jgi:hypothetical protein
VTENKNPNQNQTRKLALMHQLENWLRWGGKIIFLFNATNKHFAELSCHYR